VSVNFNVILFDGFETLDVFGPVEVIGRVPQQAYSIEHFSMKGGIIKSSQNVRADTKPFSEIKPGCILVPGGIGTRALREDKEFIYSLKSIISDSKHIMSVCTGSILLAAAKVLDGKKATTNKMAFDRLTPFYPGVKWIRKARWVKEDKFYTSSGVTAGIDMSLDFVADLHGMQTAECVAKSIEHIWNKDSENDPFAVFSTVTA
jgi:transcriptional regulator GlxA family with amidase domain